MRIVLIAMRTILDSSLEHPSKPPHRLMYYVTRGNLATSKATFFIWVFPKIGVPQNGWFIMEIPIEMDDLGGKPTIFGNPHIVPILKFSHGRSRHCLNAAST